MNKEYIYRGNENINILLKNKPKDLDLKELVMKWEVIRKIMKGRRRLKRKMERLYKINIDIMGLYFEEKGVLRRKSVKRIKGLGRKREKSKDSRINYRELRYNSKKGVITRRMWLSEESLPICLYRSTKKQRY